MVRLPVRLCRKIPSYHLVSLFCHSTHCSGHYIQPLAVGTHHPVEASAVTQPPASKGRGAVVFSSALPQSTAKLAANGPFVARKELFPDNMTLCKTAGSKPAFVHSNDQRKVDSTLTWVSFFPSILAVRAGGDLTRILLILLWSPGGPKQ